MLPKKNRLKKDREFKKVMRRGRKNNSANSIWFFLPENKGKKIGFVISNKVENKANRRNLAKRRLRGLARENIKEFPPGKLVILVRKKYQSKKDLQKDFKKQLNRLKN